MASAPPRPTSRKPGSRDTARRITCRGNSFPPAKRAPSRGRRFSVKLPILQEILTRTVSMADGENVVYVESELESHARLRPSGELGRARHRVLAVPRAGRHGHRPARQAFDDAALRRPPASLPPAGRSFGGPWRRWPQGERRTSARRRSREESRAHTHDPGRSRPQVRLRHRAPSQEAPRHRLGIQARGVPLGPGLGKFPGRRQGGARAGTLHTTVRYGPPGSNVFPASIRRFHVPAGCLRNRRSAAGS